MTHKPDTVEQDLAGERLKRTTMGACSFAALVRCLLEFILQLKSPLAFFLRKFIFDCVLPMPPAGGSQGPWPAPSPFLALCGTGKRPRSNRRAMRWCHQRAIHVWVSLQVAASTALSLGFERLPFGDLRWKACVVSQQQMLVARQWSAEATGLARVMAKTFTGGRVQLAERLHDLKASSLYDLRGVYGVEAESGAGGSGAAGAVKPVVADMLDLPDWGAFIPLEQELSKPTVQRWGDQSFMFKEPDEPPPDPVFLCSRREWLKTIKRLCAANLLVFLELVEIACDPCGKVLRSGIFCLLKANGMLRFIIDRRPQNAWERILPGLGLPHAACFTRFVLGPRDV